MTQLKFTGPDPKVVINQFRAKGVKRLYIKNLAERQDNDKNQIYLSESLDGIANALRATKMPGTASSSEGKTASSKGRLKTEAALSWIWLEDGHESPAPDAKLIYYFQYPEVRLSGFLRRSPNPPDSLRRRHRNHYGRRTLMFGTSGSTVFAAVLAGSPGSDHPLIANTETSLISPVLRELQLEENNVESTMTALLGRWHPATILRNVNTGPEEFRGNQAPGYTLEALCGIPANADSGPDLFGAELKTFRFSSRVTLMTPVADGGEWARLRARGYLLRYGHEGKDGGSIRFTGTHRIGKSTEGRTLVMSGDWEDVVQGGSVDLVRESDGLVMESWSGDHITSAWLKKHLEAYYVKYEYDRQLNKVMFDGYFKCSMTSPERLLKSIGAGIVFYDPAHTLKSGEPLKVRPQWRASTAKRSFDDHLRKLYVHVEQRI